MERRMRAWISFLAALGLASLACGMARRPRTPAPAKEGKMTDVSDLTVTDVSPSRWSGAYCSSEEPGAVLVKDAQAWAGLWKKDFDKEAPPVDFSKYFAVAVFAGLRNTGGFSVELLAPSASDSEVAIGYRIKSPAPGAFVTMAFTQPFAVQLYRKTALPVKLEERR